jgi:hypothetical protein
MILRLLAIAHQLATQLITGAASRERAPHPNSMGLSALRIPSRYFGHWPHRPRGILLNPSNRNLRLWVREAVERRACLINLSNLRRLAT